MKDKYHALFCKRLSSTISLKASFSLFSKELTILKGKVISVFQ